MMANRLWTWIGLRRGWLVQTGAPQGSVEGVVAQEFLHGFCCGLGIYNPHQNATGTLDAVSAKLRIYLTRATAAPLDDYAATRILAAKICEGLQEAANAQRRADANVETVQN